MAEPNSLGSLGAAITSPAKLAFIGYCVLVYADKIKPAPTPLAFLGVVTVFLVVQVLHDDYLRIWLNRRAQQGCSKKGPPG
jgi:hypothetical protein